MPAEKSESAEAPLKPSKDADLELLVSRLQRSCTVLLILSILRQGSFGGVLAFCAAASVLCCSAPGARGVAHSARYAKVFAILAAVLAVHSCVAPVGMLLRGIPPEVAQEVELRCESMDPVLTDSLISWVRNTTRGIHERFHKGDDSEHVFYNAISPPTLAARAQGRSPPWAKPPATFAEAEANTRSRCAKLTRGAEHGRLTESAPAQLSPGPGPGPGPGPSPGPVQPRPRSRPRCSAAPLQLLA